MAAMRCDGEGEGISAQIGPSFASVPYGAVRKVRVVWVRPSTRPSFSVCPPYVHATARLRDCAPEPDCATARQNHKNGTSSQPCSLPLDTAAVRLERCAEGVPGWGEPLSRARVAVGICLRRISWSQLLVQTRPATKTITKMRFRQRTPIIMPPRRFRQQHPIT